MDTGSVAARCNLIFTLHYHPGANAREIAEEHERWNRQLCGPMIQSVRPPANGRNPERPLRVGYVSGDFRDHVVGRNIRPLLRHHDRRSFQVFCYAGVRSPDWLTAEFREGAERWRSTLGVKDEELADMIREDGVDILVDLAQHTAGNRLLMFAHRPAPVQVSFAGYPESAGVEAIKHRISDRYLESQMGDGTRSTGSGRESELGSRSSAYRAGPLHRLLLVLRSVRGGLAAECSAGARERKSDLWELE